MGFRQEKKVDIEVYVKYYLSDYWFDLVSKYLKQFDQHPKLKEKKKKDIDIIDFDEIEKSLILKFTNDSNEIVHKNTKTIKLYCHLFSLTLLPYDQENNPDNLLELSLEVSIDMIKKKILDVLHYSRYRGVKDSPIKDIRYIEVIHVDITDVFIPEGE